MSYKGKIYLGDHNGENVGIGQDFEVMQIDGGYAGFLTAPDIPVQFTEAWETEALCVSNIKGGGTVIIIEEDDF